MTESNTFCLHNLYKIKCRSDVVSGSDEDNIILAPNTYTYPFSVQIPLGAPSSYEAHIGRVRYVMSANVDRPWAFDMHTKHMITVMRPLDLNTMPSLIVSSIIQYIRLLSTHSFLNITGSIFNKLTFRQTGSKSPLLCACC